LHGGWEFGPRTQFAVNLLASNDKLILADVDRGEFANATYKNRVIWLKWGADWSERLRSETVISISQIANRRVGTLMLPGIVSGSLDETRDFDAIGFKQDWTFIPSDNWMFSFGVDGKDQEAIYHFESSKVVTPPFDEILDNVPVESRFFDIAPEGAQYSAYVEVRWALLPNLILDAGLRWDRQSYTSTKGDEQSSPRLSILYQAGERTEIRLGWGQYSQAQEINELQISDGVDTFFVAQRAEHVVANLKHQFQSDINVEVSYFRKSFRSVRPRFENAFNSLTLLPEIQFDRYRIDPISAEAHGAELMVSEGDAGQELFWWFSYAWGEVHTGWPKSVLPAEELNTSQYSVFHTLDVRVSREFDVRRGDLTVFLEVSNLYDRENTCCTEYSITTGSDGPLLVEKEARWLPLLPSLGVIWRF